MINMVKRFIRCILKLKNMLHMKEEGTFAKFKM